MCARIIVLCTQALVYSVVHCMPTHSALASTLSPALRAPFVFVCSDHPQANVSAGIAAKINQLPTTYKENASAHEAASSSSLPAPILSSPRRSARGLAKQKE